MTRLVEILVGISALAGVATFLGFRAAFRRTVRSLGRRPGLEQGTDRQQLEKGNHES